MKFALVALLAASSALAQDWPQWANDSQHAERTHAVGQPFGRNAVDLVYDPLASREIFAYNGDLLVHYQAPLVDGNDVYMMTKSGSFDANTFATQTWNESKFSWQNGTLVKAWDFTTDWKPPGNISDFFEPVFHPALANDFLYVPAAGGSIFKVNKSNGASVRIHPFGSGINPNTYVVSPLTVDASGNILYNAIQIVPANDSTIATSSIRGSCASRPRMRRKW